MATGRTRGGTSQRGRPLPVDDHGRRLSTTADAAAHYRAAQRAVPALGAVRSALSRALEADEGFQIAGTALAALEQRDVVERRRPSTSWERRHADVVTAARSPRPERAVDLLRDHLLDVGCDPVACLVVTRFVDPAEVDDLLADAPGCHPWKPGA